jgi:hypothetical protein
MGASVLLERAMAPIHVCASRKATISLVTVSVPSKRHTPSRLGIAWHTIHPTLDYVSAM